MRGWKKNNFHATENKTHSDEKNSEHQVVAAYHLRKIENPPLLFWMHRVLDLLKNSGILNEAKTCT